MQRSSQFRPHKALLLCLIKTRVLEYSESNQIKTCDGTGSLLGLMIQFVSALMIGWLGANWIADYGYRGTSDIFSHSDWALQGAAWDVNIALFVNLSLSIFIKFATWVSVSFKNKFRLGTGFWALLLIWVASQGATFFLSPKLEYDLWIDTPYTFGLVWQFLSCMTFLGVDNLWKSIRDARREQEQQIENP
jgi:hypothetical protein